MNARSGFFAVSIAVLLMTLHSSQMQLAPSQSAEMAQVPAGVDVRIAGSDANEPLLLAGNTACNPRVTVCEE